MEPIVENKISLKLNDALERCFIPKNQRDYDENTTAVDYTVYRKDIKLNIMTLCKLMPKRLILDKSSTIQLFSLLLLLLEELNTPGPWNEGLQHNMSEYLKAELRKILGYDISEVFLQSDDDTKSRVFAYILKGIHKKMTSESWKRYPSITKVYTSVINMPQKYAFSVNLQSAFPATLLQLDDHNTGSKINGFKCCFTILNGLDPDKYHCTGYELVIFEAIKKHLSYREPEILSNALLCMSKLLPLLKEPTKKWNRCDDVLEIVMENLFLETKIEKKCIYFNNIPQFVQIHKQNCIRWDCKFRKIVAENLESCTTKDYAEKLLDPCLTALTSWLHYCWPMWEHVKDYQVHSALIILLHICCESPSQNTETIKRIMDTMIILLKLEDANDRSLIFKEYSSKKKFNPDFKKKISKLKVLCVK